MQSYLSFQLYGPLASWGEQAVGESRHSATHPTRSAVLGLLAAAVGIRRDEEQRLQALFKSVKLGIKVLNGGVVLKDYHTVQVPPEDKKGCSGSSTASMAAPKASRARSASCRNMPISTGLVSITRSRLSTA